MTEQNQKPEPSTESWAVATWVRGPELQRERECIASDLDAAISAGVRRELQSESSMLRVSTRELEASLRSAKARHAETNRQLELCAAEVSQLVEACGPASKQRDEQEHAPNSERVDALLADRIELISNNKQLAIENASLWEKLTTMRECARCDPGQCHEYQSELIAERDKLKSTIDALTERQRELLRDREGLAEKLKRAEAAYKGAEDWCHELRRIADAVGLDVGQRLSRDVAPAVVSIVRERDRLKEELTLLYEAFHPQHVANPREVRQHLENLRQEGHWEALTAVTRELHDEKVAHEVTRAELDRALDASQGYFDKWGDSEQELSDAKAVIDRMRFELGVNDGESPMEAISALKRLPVAIASGVAPTVPETGATFEQSASAPPYTAEQRAEDVRHLRTFFSPHHPSVQAALSRLAAAPQDTDAFKQGTRVEILQHGEWDAATVYQRGGSGRLLVKLDKKWNDEQYYWVSREEVRLAAAGVTDVAPTSPPSDDNPPASDAPLVCSHCGKPASCIGRYDNMIEDAPACDDCCGHGCEDGHCEPIDVAAPLPRPVPPGTTLTVGARYRITRVKGHSSEPHFKVGDELLCGTGPLLLQPGWLPPVCEPPVCDLSFIHRAAWVAWGPIREGCTYITGLDLIAEPEAKP